MKLPTHGAGLPGNVDIVTRSAFLSAFMAGYPPDFPVTGFRVEKEGLELWIFLLEIIQPLSSVWVPAFHNVEVR
jgi:hypothetical protein